MGERVWGERRDEREGGEEREGREERGGRGRGRERGEGKGPVNHRILSTTFVFFLRLVFSVDRGGDMATLILTLKKGLTNYLVDTSPVYTSQKKGEVNNTSPSSLPLLPLSSSLSSSLYPSLSLPQISLSKYLPF